MSTPRVSITRASDRQTTTIANGAALATTAVQMRDYASGHIYIPDSWSDANMGFKVSSDGSTFAVLKDDIGVPIQITTINTTTGAWYAIPDQAFAAWYIKPWSKHKTAATESDVNQTGDKALVIVLKG